MNDDPIAGEAPTPNSASSSVASAILPAGIEAGRIREELERIVISAAFRTSRRTCLLVRHIVECALKGNIEDLKERRIGADVFGRLADYDTNTDHIVRSVAGEVRRRLGQYYTQSGADSEIRIELLAGSYVPQFHLVPEQTALALPTSAPVLRPLAPRPLRLGRWPMGIAAAVCLLAAAIWLAGRAGDRRTPTERFWQPMYASSSPVLLCAPGGGSRADAPDAQEPKTVIEFALAPSRRIHLYDAMVLARVTGLLQANGKAYKLLNRAGTTSFRELQSGPFVLVGSLNNEWSLRLTKGFRFSFSRASAGARVLDQLNPANEAWRVDPASPIEQLSRDYAIVSRFRDPQTQQPALILAGIGPWGSLAAGEFVTNPEYLKKLAGVAPDGWQNRNLQVVIATDVIHGSSGPPKVIATHFW